MSTDQKVVSLNTRTINLEQLSLQFSSQIYRTKYSRSILDLNLFVFILMSILNPQLLYKLNKYKLFWIRASATIL